MYLVWFVEKLKLKLWGSMNRGMGFGLRSPSDGIQSPITRKLEEKRKHGLEK
jgi:hypothetical protein